jgi:hypothetical protein
MQHWPAALDVADRALDEAERIVTGIGDRPAQRLLSSARALLAGHEDPPTLRWVRLIEAEMSARRGDPAIADQAVLAVIAEAERDGDRICIAQARQLQATLGRPDPGCGP